MQAVINVLNGIGDGLRSALDFLIGIVNDLVAVAVRLGELLVAIPQWLSMFFPAELVVSFAAVLAIAVIYKIIGREG